MKIFADNRINIASVLQKEHHQNGKVPVVILTENSIERDYDIALNEINKLEISHEFPIRFRIEDLIMKVVKFGGSSVANADQISKVINIVKSDVDRKVVVVSAPENVSQMTKK